ncbi:MAG: ATP-dependent Clp protease ATP-binding subunit ClpX [Patiriisocius sp.]|jgi:ATP-dependent Clp protease ATP-binding subunit ClpX
MGENTKCSFCGKHKNEVQLLIAGESGHICEVCATQAADIVDHQFYNEEQDDPNIIDDLILLKPSEIKEHLDRYIVGQDVAKKILSVSVYNHYKRIKNSGRYKEDDLEIEKSNVLMVGETGTGKTLLAKTIAKVLKVPFAIADATILTEAGYVGEDVESILSKLLQASDYDVSKAERGIVFIDEIDKIARKGDNASITRDVSGEGVQQALLKLLEGSDVNVPPQGGRKHPDQKLIKINTKNILFISGGAFDGIASIIKKRVNLQAIGFGTEADEGVNENNILEHVSPMDIRSFGLIPELLGRFPVVTHLHPLDKTILKLILTEPVNALTKQYARLFEMDGVNLTFEPKAIDFIVEKAEELKLGARGLRSICEVILTDYMFDIPGNEELKRLKISRGMAESQFGKSKLGKLKVA